MGFALITQLGTTRLHSGWQMLFDKANSIKLNISNIFTEAYVSNEETKSDPTYDCWEKIMEINPSIAEFKDTKEMMDLNTSFQNLYDELTNRLSASGYADDGLERRIRCWRGPPGGGGWGYLGAPGRPKNTSLYYWFLVMTRANEQGVGVVCSSKTLKVGLESNTHLLTIQGAF